MAHPVNTGITIKCHKKSSYRKINKLMEDEDFRAQFNDKLENMLLRAACDKFDLIVSISAIEEGEEDSDAEGALRIAEKLTTMFPDTIAMVNVHDNHGAWRKTYKDGKSVFTERCTESYYSDGEFRADNKEALYKIGDEEEDIWVEWKNYQPEIEGAKIAPKYKIDWEILADLSDGVSDGEYETLMEE